VIRFYLDEDVLPLAKVLAGLRTDVAHPGHPEADPVDPGWLVISRDAHIEDHRAWIGAVAENRAKLVVLSGRDAGGTWGQLEIVLAQWRAIEALAAQDGPFIHAATRSGLRAVPLR
jgi:hypothetical protein